MKNIAKLFLKVETPGDQVQLQTEGAESKRSKKSSSCSKEVIAAYISLGQACMAKC